MKKYTLVITIIFAQISIIGSDTSDFSSDSGILNPINPRLITFQERISHWTQFPTMLNYFDSRTQTIHVDTSYTTKSAPFCLVISSRWHDEYFTRVYIINKQSQVVTRRYFTSLEIAREWFFNELESVQSCSCCNIQ